MNIPWQVFRPRIQKYFRLRQAFLEAGGQILDTAQCIMVSGTARVAHEAYNCALCPFCRHTFPDIAEFLGR